MIFDPQKVRLEWIKRERTRRMQERGWMIVGHGTGEEGEDAVMAPQEISLDFDRLSGVECVLIGKGVPMIKIGTLHTMLSPVPSLEEYGLEGDEDRTVQIVRERMPKDGRRVTMFGKHPEVAEYGFLRETGLLWRQLLAMGYERVISLPTDSRRERVYKKMGFTETKKREGTTVYLVGNLRDLIHRRG